MQVPLDSHRAFGHSVVGDEQIGVRRQSRQAFTFAVAFWGSRYVTPCIDMHWSKKT
jgi:hypothetical protein